MKKISLILTLLVFVLSYTSMAQTEYSYKQTSKVSFDVESGDVIAEVFVLDGKEFPVFQLESGSKYIKAISSSGSSYPVWIHTNVGDTFEGRNVYQSKKGNRCTYFLTKNGYPYARWLDFE